MQKLVLGACGALIAAGAGGVLTHSDPAGSTGLPSRSGPPTNTSSHVPPASAVASSLPFAAPSGPGSAPGPDSGRLGSGLLTPTDMGGYYRLDAASGERILTSALCLGGLQPAPAQSGRAVTALLGPGAMSVPTIVEVVTSYPSGPGAAVYRSLTSAVGSCRPFSLVFGGAPVSVPLSPTSPPAVGQAEAAWTGTFTESGRQMQLQLGVVLQGQTVLTLLYVDTVPPSDPIMGDFPSTLSDALGKLA